MVDWDFPQASNIHFCPQKRDPKQWETKTPAFPVGFESFLFSLMKGVVQATGKNGFSELFGENFLVREDGCKHV